MPRLLLLLDSNLNLASSQPSRTNQVACLATRIAAWLSANILLRDSTDMGPVDVPWAEYLPQLATSTCPASPPSFPHIRGRPIRFYNLFPSARGVVDV